MFGAKLHTQIINSIYFNFKSFIRCVNWMIIANRKSRHGINDETSRFVVILTELSRKKSATGKACLRKSGHSSLSDYENTPPRMTHVVAAYNQLWAARVCTYVSKQMNWDTPSQTFARNGRRKQNGPCLITTFFCTTPLLSVS